VQRRIYANEADFTTAVFVGNTIEGFKDRAGCCGDEAGGDCGEGHVDEEEIDEGLGWADHIFCRRDEFDD